MGLCLTPSQLRDYWENGFLVVPNVFDKKDLDEVGSCIDRLVELAASVTTTQLVKGAQFVVEGNRIDRIVWAGAAEPRLLDYAEDPRILEPVSQILETREMQQLISQVHPKLPGDAVAFDWHQDSQHRRYGTPEWRDVNGKGSYVQTMLAVDPVTQENGPVVFIRGSQKLGHIEPSEVMKYVDEKKAVPCLMNPGDLAFFGPYVIHGSQPNNSTGKRRVLINGYACPGANSKVYPGEGSGRYVRL